MAPAVFFPEVDRHATFRLFASSEACVSRRFLGSAWLVALVLATSFDIVHWFRNESFDEHCVAIGCEGCFLFLARPIIVNVLFIVSTNVFAIPLWALGACLLDSCYARHPRRYIQHWTVQAIRFTPQSFWVSDSAELGEIGGSVAIPRFRHFRNASIAFCTVRFATTNFGVALTTLKVFSRSALRMALV
jgi:hypothetical protein